MAEVQATWLPGANFTRVVKPKLPRCEMQVQVEPNARGNRRKHGKACGNYASITLLGKNFCLRHAQVAALAYLLG